MIIISIVVIALAALFFVLLRSGEAHPVSHRHDPATDRALRVARRHFTAGRIDAAEYERIVRALSR